MTVAISSSSQDYLKCVFSLQDSGLRPTTKAIADRMGVSAASATNMLKKLGATGLVRYMPYKGAELTEAGRKVALEVVRHHRLLETYLAEALGVPWDEVHAEAEVLEHVLSEELEERIAARLGHPTSDPHGHPIPRKDLTLPAISDRVLWGAEVGDEVEVDRVSDSLSEVLRYLADLGIRPGVQVTVVDRGPVDGPLFVKVKGDADVHALSRELSEAVWVA